MDYAALKTQLATYPAGTTDAAILADITSATSASASSVWVDVSVADVEGYLSLQGVLSGMESWLSANPTPPAGQQQAWVAAKELLRTVSSPHITVFGTSDGPSGQNAIGIQGMLAALLANPPALITQAQHDFLTGLMQQPMSWSETHGCSGVTLGDFQTARAQP